MNRLARAWAAQELPDVDGIIEAQGRLHWWNGQRFLDSGAWDQAAAMLDVSVLATRDCRARGCRVRCGEASAHGSIGVVVVESLADGTPRFALISERSNPFDQVEEKGGYVLVLSTSGAVFRFREGFADATLSIPD